MGQYYHPIYLSADGTVLAWMLAHRYQNGLKLMEHSYMKNNFVCTFEFGLTPGQRFHKTRVVWAGDYADPEPGQEGNLYQQCNKDKEVIPAEQDTTNFLYLVNHTTRQFVDKLKVPQLHPLPLLTCEGNGRGGGDYQGDSPLIGCWARHVISVEQAVDPDFEEISFTP